MNCGVDELLRGLRELSCCGLRAAPAPSPACAPRRPRAAPRAACRLQPGLQLVLDLPDRRVDERAGAVDDLAPASSRANSRARRASAPPGAAWSFGLLPDRQPSRPISRPRFSVSTRLRRSPADEHDDRVVAEALAVALGGLEGVRALARPASSSPRSAPGAAAPARRRGHREHGRDGEHAAGAGAPRLARPVRSSPSRPCSVRGYRWSVATRHRFGRRGRCQIAGAWRVRGGDHSSAPVARTLEAHHEWQEPRDRRRTRGGGLATLSRASAYAATLAGTGNPDVLIRHARLRSDRRLRGR